MSRTTRVLMLSMAALLSVACGNDDGGADSTQSIQPLDPEGWHYGGQYADWAGEWWRWLNELVPTDDCGEPVGDTTGKLCALGQDSDSKVFFLAGTWGSKVTRKKCVVPDGKALFFPLVSTSADNGGVPEENWETDKQLKARTASYFKTMPASKLKLSVDGTTIEDLERFAVENAPYEYTLPDPQNMYECLGAPGVTGTYSGFTSGYYILLPPLGPGEHELVFGGEVEGDDPFVTEATYDPLTIE